MSMKRFRLSGHTANWIDGLRMTALNLSTLAEEISTPIPADKRMYLNVASNVYHVEDARREVLDGEISDADKDFILTKIKAQTPNFLLTLDGKVVGYANLHSRHKGSANATDADDEDTATATPAPFADISEIVDDNLVLLIIPAPAPVAPATTPAPAPKPKKRYTISQSFTIIFTEEVDAEDEETAQELATDVRTDVENLLSDAYGDSQILECWDLSTADYNIHCTCNE